MYKKETDGVINSLVFYCKDFKIKISYPVGNLKREEEAIFDFWKEFERHSINTHINK